MSGDDRALPQCEVKTVRTPDLTVFHVRSSGYGYDEIGRLTGKVLRWDVKRRFRFVVHAAG